MNVSRKYSPEPILLDVKQAAIRLGTTVSAVRGLLWDSQLPYIKLGKRFLIQVSALDDWIARNLKKNGG